MKPLLEGGWLARSTGGDAGTVQVEAPTRDAALDALRAEIRYRIELCPCSGVAEDYVELDVSEQARAPWKGSVF